MYLDITQKYAEEFDEKCARVDAHGFLRFLTEPNANDISILNLIANVEAITEIKPHHKDFALDTDETTFINILNDFFSKYLPQKADEVKQILNKTHSFFIDREGKTHIRFEKVLSDDKRSSSVGHSGRNTYLEFKVFLHNNLSDLRITAHEIAHALSSHNQQIVKLIRSNSSREELDKITRSFEKDCIGEIEGAIIERLFNYYLMQKGIYTESNIENYENSEEDSLLCEINLIREERDILKELSCPVTKESLEKLVKSLVAKKNYRLLDRIEKMHDNKDRYSSKMFRYVVAKVVGKKWINNFIRLKSDKQREEMLDNFQQYLDNTHRLDLDSACEYLLGDDFCSIVEDYITHKLGKKKHIDLSEEKDI